MKFWRFAEASRGFPMEEEILLSQAAEANPGYPASRPAIGHRQALSIVEFDGDSCFSSMVCECSCRQPGCLIVADYSS
jgi:hypothetical protein